jgi:DNA polymerase
MHHMNIDLETYSSVPLSKAGLYKYAQSPDFQILLFGYSIDGAPARTVDMTVPGTYLPQEALQMMFSRDCIKHAFNAAFEWYCLSRYFQLEKNRDWQPEVWLPQWRDTQLHALYCGYPTALKDVGAAIGLPEDKQKLATGKALIKYFCVPCAATKSNGGRTRNLPRHDPDKWELFKIYNGQDVVTESEIARRLESHPVPDAVQKQWEMDQRINLRGVAVDLQLMDGAIQIGTNAELMDAILELSALIGGSSNG